MGRLVTTHGLHIAIRGTERCSELERNGQQERSLSLQKNFNLSDKKNAFCGLEDCEEVQRAS